MVVEMNLELGDLILFIISLRDTCIELKTERSVKQKYSVQT